MFKKARDKTDGKGFKKEKKKSFVYKKAVK